MFATHTLLCPSATKSKFLYRGPCSLLRCTSASCLSNLPQRLQSWLPPMLLPCCSLRFLANCDALQPGCFVHLCTSYQLMRQALRRSPLHTPRRQFAGNGCPEAGQCQPVLQPAWAAAGACERTAPCYCWPAALCHTPDPPP
jgi:hypothetical protein